MSSFFPLPRRIGAAVPLWAATLTLFVTASTARALEPRELLLVCNADVRESVELAEYYAKVRGVPPQQICRLRLGGKPGEEMTLAAYQSLIRQPIRAFLNEHQLTPAIRCLVTFYGLPIRVAQSESTPASRRLVEQLEKEFVTALDGLEKASLEMENIGAPTPRQPSARKPTIKDYPSILRRYAAVRKETQERLTRSTAQPETPRHFQALLSVLQDVEGVASVVDQLRLSGGDPNDEPHRRLAAMRENVAKADQEIGQGLSRGVLDANRPELRKLVRQYHGVGGLLGMIDGDLQYLRTQESAAAVDSELTLLWYEEYPRSRWIPNMLSWANRSNEGLRHQMSPLLLKTRVLMVARLDASRPAVARRMIDDSLAAEKGLRGNIYLDARGLTKNDAMSQYDGNLRELSLLFKEASLRVTLDDRADVFGIGACPGTMLYCGWYSLRRFVDSFTFVPGAVAFHIASFEAISLKEAGERGWCANLLDHGAAATVGPVAEPYLHAFPLPREFFGLLATGRFSLVECYAYTANLNSWMMMLLGDPLYRPFARNPSLKLEQVFAGPAVPPEFRPGATMPATDPASLPAPATSAPIGVKLLVVPELDAWNCSATRRTEIRSMQVRFVCPACKGTHIADIPETTIHMTCSRTHRAVRLRLTAGGDVKSAVVGEGADALVEEAEED